MKKLFITLFVTLFLLIPSSVGAESIITLKCDKKEITASETLNCTLTSTVDSGISYDKLVANIEYAGVSSITFKGGESFSGGIADDQITLNSTSLVNNTIIGTLQISFNSDTTSDNSIKLSNIKLYNGDNEVASVSNADATVKVSSTINTLEELTVSECNDCKLSPSFKKNVTIYTVKAKANKIKISAKASGNAKVTGTGTKTLDKEKETFKVTVTSEAGTTKEYKIVVTREELNDVSLKSLTIDKGTLTPNFSNDTTSYKATVDSDKVVISALANDSNATVMGLGEKKLEYGRNEFTIIVAAEDGTTKSYLININRPDTRNANAYLKELTINGEDIDFEKDIIEYTYNIGEDINELEIEAIPENETSKVKIEGNENFIIGENVITITVTAEDSSQKVYKIIAILGEAELKSEIFLDELKITGYDISFEKEKFDYNITIDDEKELDIMTFSNLGYNTEIIGNKDLKDGSIIKIIVTDDEGHSSIYKIKVAKETKNVVSKNSNDINYIPIIMTSLLVILFIADTVLLIKRIRNK